MPSSSRLFEQVEQALGDARVLDRDLMRELLDLAMALEVALIDACRSNLEMRTMDRHVASASNTLKEAIEALNRAYTLPVKIDAPEVEGLFEAQLSAGRRYVEEKR